MNNQAFITYCRSQIAKSFQLTREGIKDSKQKYRAEGLLQAARLLDILSKEDIDSMMEEQHLAVFGESMTERSNRKIGLETLKHQHPDEYYEIPAIQRMNKPKK